jgi:hypothetical protein
MWLISLALNITSTLFAISTLMLQSQLLQVPKTPRDHMQSRSYLFLGTLSIFFFLAGLVIFFFTIHKIVGIVVLIVLIAVGLFEVVYLVLSLGFGPCLCRPLLPLSYSSTGESGPTGRVVEYGGMGGQREEASGEACEGRAHMRLP